MRNLLLCCAVLSPCSALELVRRDLSLAIEALPVAFDYTLTTPGGSYTGDDEFDRALGLRLGGRWSFSSPGARGAVVAGADLRLGDATYEGDGIYRTIGIGASVGYAHTVGRRWTVFAEPLVEYGWATLDFDATVSAPAVAAEGSHLLYGLRVGGLYALSSRWLIEPSVGWVAIVSDTKASTRTYELEQQGPMVGLGIVYRLSAAPPRLE